MQARLSVVTPSTDPLLSLQELQAHCRVVDGADDDYLERLGAAVLSWIGAPDGWLGQSLLSQTLRLDLPQWPYCLKLPAGPVSAVSSVKYYDTANTLQTVAGSNYFLDGDHIEFAETFSEPQLYARRLPVRIEYVAGRESAAAVPEAIRQAALLLVGHYYENREEVTIGDPPAQIPMGADALLAPFRRWSAI